jgi:hypothetical protein
MSTLTLTACSIGRTPGESVADADDERDDVDV